MIKQEKARDLYKDTVESAPIGIAHLGPDGSWLHANQCLCELVGYPPEDLLQTTLATIVHPDDLSEALASLQDLSQGRRTSYTTEIRLRRPDSALTWCELNLSALPLEHAGPSAYILAVLTDISARRAAHTALQERERSYRFLADYATDMISRHTPDGVYLDATPACRTLLGYEPEEIIGKMAYDFFFPEDIETIQQAHAATLKDAATVTTVQYRIRTKGGSYRWVETNSQIIREEGWPEEIVAVTHDISEHKATEAALRKARDEARSASQAKTRFLHNVSHELRTPLNAIIGYSEMLVEDVEPSTPEMAHADLRKITQAGRYLLALVDNVLTVSQIEEGRLELTQETFDVLDVMQQANDDIREVADGKGTQLDIHAKTELGAMKADRAKVLQCLRHLLGNAIKFTEGGSITLDAEREASPEGDWLVFRVSDTGIGMTQKQISELFQLFFKAHASATRFYDGAGLGLAITWRLCKRMGGDIDVESRPEVGSTFTMRLPAHPPSGLTTPPSSTDMEHTSRASETPLAAEDSSGRGEPTSSPH